jgi:hypothetical protein
MPAFAGMTKKRNSASHALALLPFGFISPLLNAPRPLPRLSTGGEGSEPAVPRRGRYLPRFAHDSTPVTLDLITFFNP